MEIRAVKTSFLALPVVASHWALCFWEVSFLVYFRHNWKRAKKIAKAGLWEDFRHMHYKLVMIWIKVFFLLLFLSPHLFLLHAFLSPKSSKALCVCMRVHPQLHLYLQVCAHPRWTEEQSPGTRELSFWDHLLVVKGKWHLLLTINLQESSDQW